VSAIVSEHEGSAPAGESAARIGADRPVAEQSCDIAVVEDRPAELVAALTAYLRGCPADSGACFEHDPRWLTVLDTGLGHRTFMLVARRGRPLIDPPANLPADHPICGYLPLSLLKTRLLGTFLVSLPYLNRAGVVADDPAVARALIEQAAGLARRLDARYLELRHHVRSYDHDLLDTTRNQKVRMVLGLPGDTEFLWKRISAKVRNQVRKGEKSALSIRWGGRDLLDAFYKVFSVNMRDLGTPVYPKKMFAAILEQFGQQAELAVVEHGGRAVAAAMLVHDAHDGGGITQVPSASSLRRYNNTNANMWMYYHLLCRAIERGSVAFDFGRSSMDSGTYKFKKQWGAEPAPTVWQYHVRLGDVGDVRPDNPKYQRRINTWKRLPVWVTRLIGPRIIRGIP